MLNFANLRYETSPAAWPLLLVDAENASSFKTPSTSVGCSILTDSHGRFHNYLRISLTERCNLRCTFEKNFYLIYNLRTVRAQ